MCRPTQNGTQFIGTGTPVQLNIRVDSALRDRFKEACKVLRKDQSEMIEQMIAAFCDDIETIHVRHMDGSLCPLSQLLINLERALLTSWRGKTGPQ